MAYILPERTASSTNFYIYERIFLSFLLCCTITYFFRAKKSLDAKAYIVVQSSI